MDKLNNRPRKCLGFKTPNQVFFGIKPPVALGRVYIWTKSTETTVVIPVKTGIQWVFCFWIPGLRPE